MWQQSKNSALELSEPLSDSMRYPRVVAPCGSAQRIAIRTFQQRRPEIIGIRAYHFINKKNHGQSGRSDQRNRSPRFNDDREGDNLGSFKDKTINRVVPETTYYDKGNGVDQCLCKERPSREPCYASRCPACGDLATEKEQHHEVDHGGPPGIYDLCLERKTLYRGGQ